VLGAEGRLIQRVTELLREVSARRAMFCRAILPGPWPKPNGKHRARHRRRPDRAIRGTAVVRRTVRRWRRSRLDRAWRPARRTPRSADHVDNEIGDIARAAEVFARPWSMPTPRASAWRACEQRLAEESYRKLFEIPSTGSTSRRPVAHCSTPTRRCTDDGLFHAHDLIDGLGHVAIALCRSGGAEEYEK